MFYAGAMPWHRIGTGVAEAQTAADAMELSRTGWAVRKVPALAPSMDGTGVVTSPDLFALQRTDNGFILGHATDAYEPFSNAEGFSFLDSLVQDGVMLYETAGSIRHGRMVFILARLAEDMRIAGEPWRRYVLGALGHDGGSAIRWKTTSVRVVCANTLDAAIAERGGTTFSIRHTASLHERLREARRVFEATTEAQRRLAEFLSRAAETRVSDAALAAVEEDLFGKVEDRGPRIATKVGAFKRILGAEVVRNDQTAYSVLNAITGYVDHVRSGDSRSRNSNEERRFEATQFGAGVGVKAGAIKVLARETGLALLSPA
jgi:phage/plasmid-like protein (TIGR03299 family)